jgi:class 3 adenylate cyclase
VADADGVHRHVRRAYRAETTEDVASLASAVLGRARHAAMPTVVLLTPRQHPEAIATYVDKFIGDAVLAIWGARPSPIPTTP